MTEDQLFAWIPRVVWGVVIFGGIACAWDMVVCWAAGRPPVQCLRCGAVTTRRRALRDGWEAPAGKLKGFCPSCLVWVTAEREQMLNLELWETPKKNLNRRE